MTLKLGSIMWASHLPMLIRAGKNLEFIELTAFSGKSMEDEPEKIDKVLQALSGCDVILLYRSSGAYWDTIAKQLQKSDMQVPIICVGHDPSYWSLSTVNPEIIAKVNAYISINGEENFTNMLRYIAREVCHFDLETPDPVPVPWEGLYHPEKAGIFSNVKEYLKWYEGYFENRRARLHTYEHKGTVGILFSRHAWVNGNLNVENELIRALEDSGLKVIPVFSNSVKDTEKGCKGSGEVVCETFLNKNGQSTIDAMIKMQFFPLSVSREQVNSGKPVAGDAVDILTRLDVPVLTPFSTAYKTVAEWQEEPQGLGGNLIGFSIAMPEFEGAIEPIIIGGLDNHANELARKAPISERCQTLSRRIANWVRLKNIPKKNRKVAFILHNNPCASVEATVGGGAQLDTLESVADILKQMQMTGYSVDPPADGKDLIETIMDRKAISEFRWTTVDEIVSKGGVLKQVTKEEYGKWFDTLSKRVKDRMNNAWGKPPGEEINGVPAAMVYNGKILVTGVSYGNAVICIQPKRGCAGTRCDGQVCKILHDPDIPPPHQYMATYRYIERDFGAHVIVHVGTHGNLEFLPGKNVGLSSDCYPDIAIGDMPHLYIYNADNPAEGTIAKRRSLAVLTDHMQTVMVQGGLYEGLEELDGFLSEYERTKNTDPGRAHTLRHMIMDTIRETGLENEIKVSAPQTTEKKKPIALSGLEKEDLAQITFDEIAAAAHGALSRIRNTRIQDGLHIFGRLPEDGRRVDLINSIMSYDAGQTVSLRKTVASFMGLTMADLLADGGKVDHIYQKSHGELLETIDTLCKDFIRKMLTNGHDREKMTQTVMGDALRNKSDIGNLKILAEKVKDINQRIDASREIDSLLHGFKGRYIPSGPSGLMTRGRDDILPTGRNFYSLDPHRIPTKAAWKIGRKLADGVIEKHFDEEGRYPENVAIFWMAGDVMYADGEGMAQIMALIGVMPVWLSNGRIKGFEIIPMNKLNRPRIDVTVRVSGISRDNFPNCIELIDEAVQAVAALDEPLEMNFVRKHTVEKMKEDEDSANQEERFRNATFRVFAAKPGTYSAGTQLAVYASAWKEEKDLSDIFIYWNGYAYGKGVFGQERHTELIHSLKTVDLTYNKVVTDEKDLFGCCCYFGTHGGMTAAARTISGQKVKTYYGDTREPEHVAVRDMADEVRRVVRTKLLNPQWIEGMKRHGYKGAGDISKRVGRVYGWEATTQEVDDWIFDDITKTFVLDKENREFFEQNNPWALEEIGRRLLEAESRGLWKADPEVLEQLKEYYLEIEGWIEDRMGDVTGDFQGGAVDIMTTEDVEDWGKMMAEVKSKISAAIPAASK